ncbi:MAG: 6-hydroxymethylpterin diphosphokinase MptE-like protein [Desulfuromonadales bacterium]|nr:6-hydroxymethylpterin diphosphokinase MptE-like protein [Desulfuromonadales bacterium]MDW7757236.1 6-hydroxymethylpterin diphosphokinase MptE-like protein [Desulfuromonadales bacterium]
MVVIEQETTEAFVENHFGDRYLFSINREAFNRVGSATLYKTWFGDSLFEEDTLNILVGTDSGLLPKYIFEKGIPSGSRYLFIELPEVDSVLKKELDWNAYPESLSCVELDHLFFEPLLTTLQQYQFLNRIVLRKSLAAEDAYLPEYATLFGMVHQALEHFAWQVNGSLGNEAFIRKQLENVAENRMPATYLMGIFPGKTAIILAGGPSLDDIFPWLLANRDKVVVLAVSRVCRRLIEVGLEPDLVFSIDPHEVSFDVSKDLLRFQEKTLFVNLYHVVSSLLGQWRGRSVYVGPRFPWESPLNVDTLPAPGPTVTNLALSTAVEMGFSQIVLAGLDLCFSKEGFTHARGSNERQAGPQLHEVRSQVETNGGWMAETDSAFAEAIEQIGYQAGSARDRGVTLINPAAGAAKIPNVTHIPVEKIDMPVQEQSIYDTLQAHLPQETSASRIKYYRTVLDELAQANASLRQIKKLASEALVANAGLFGRNGLDADFRYKTKMDGIEKKLNEKYSAFVPLVKKYGIRHFIKISRVDSAKEWSDNEIEKTGQVYYEAYRDSAASLLALVENAQERVRTRLEEEKPHPDFKQLIKQWQKDGQPGRVLVWKERSVVTSTELPPEIRQQVACLEKEFAIQLDNRETAHMARSRRYANLSGVTNKALFLFKNKEKERLRNLAEALSMHPDPVAKKYLLLVQGYLSELNCDDPLALEHYLSLVSEENAYLLEDVLRRIASLSLTTNHADNALMALEYLSSISAVYMPQLAELQRLMGMHRQSLDTYANYLEKAPGDVVTMLKLGQFYSELGIVEGCRLMYRSVLEVDPDNKVAMKLLEKVKD